MGGTSLCRTEYRVARDLPRDVSRDVQFAPAGGRKRPGADDAVTAATAAAQRGLSSQQDRLSAPGPEETRVELSDRGPTIRRVGSSRPDSTQNFSAYSPERPGETRTRPDTRPTWPLFEAVGATGHNRPLAASLPAQEQRSHGPPQRTARD